MKTCVLHTVHGSLTFISSLVCRAGNSLIRSLLIRSFDICSFRSNKMSDCEGFAQIAQDKWATVSKSLMVAQRKWAMWANRSFHSLKMSEWAIRSKVFGFKKSKILFYYVLFKVFLNNFEKICESLISSFLVSDVSRSFCSNQMSAVSKSLTKNERFAQVAQRKWAMWANRSFFDKNERFARKSNELILSPAYMILSCNLLYEYLFSHMIICVLHGCWTFIWDCYFCPSLLCIYCTVYTFVCFICLCL